ncbi:hypothetical protein BLNAU_21775 [Blattamonas nauphoetae]|uniref:Uncharacterized protein n=1 Tax=Blattamonas nauphoetae TaxID=2049346 RepID=A0ABQ9WUY0_9EUKA|nr:hypothetical protein BLNAU_21775 [Blattamonas nauphoetae]
MSPDSLNSDTMLDDVVRVCGYDEREKVSMICGVFYLSCGLSFCLSQQTGDNVDKEYETLLEEIAFVDSVRTVPFVFLENDNSCSSDIDRLRCQGHSTLLHESKQYDRK